MSDKITFKELVDKISASTNNDEQSISSFITELVDIIESGLQNGETIKIDGFGKFEIDNARQIDHSSSHPESFLHFKPYKALRERLNAVTHHHALFISGHTLQQYAGETIKELLIERSRPLLHEITLEINQATESTSGMGEPASTDGERNSSTKLHPVENISERFKIRWTPAATAILMLLLATILIYLYLQQENETKRTTIKTPNSESPTTLTQIQVDSEPEKSSQSPEQLFEATNAEKVTKSIANTHQINSNDTLWSIASKEYGDGYLWPVIFRANRSLLGNPNQIPAGITVKLPNIENPGNLTESDSVSVARGYLNVYDWMKENRSQDARFYLWAAGYYSLSELQKVSDKADPSDLAFATQQ